MAKTNNTELKSRAFAEANNLGEHYILSEANSFDGIAADLYNTVVLEKCGITLDQLKKKDKLDGEFLSASVLLGGEASAERFKQNPELTEISMSIPMGGSQTLSAVFTRGKDTVVQINSKIHTAEMKRVLSHVDSLFAEVES